MAASPIYFRGLRFVLSLFSLALLFTVSACAQQYRTSGADSSKETYYEIFTGYSPYSMRLLGKTPEGQTTYFNLSRAFKIKELMDDADLYYKIGLVPYIGFTYPKRDDNGRVSKAYGMGFSPAGFSLDKKISSHFGYLISTSGGIIYMDQFFPTDKSKRLNYTFELSLSFYRKISSSAAFSLGYRFHHISNAQTGKQNPGLDSNFIYLSFLFF